MLLLKVWYETAPSKYLDTEWYVLETLLYMHMFQEELMLLRFELGHFCWMLRRLLGSDLLSQETYFYILGF